MDDKIFGWKEACCSTEGTRALSGDMWKSVAMSTRSVQAKRALSRFGELAWFSLAVEVNPCYGYLQVPRLGWRYESPQENVGSLMEEVVKEVHTQVDWTLDRTRRNWVLLPSRILREAHGLEDPEFSNVVHSINTRDREFCLRALADLELIIRHLQEFPIAEG
ncbi:hypothetical protein ACFYNL_16365 [Streptomyces sp. NPDC007808]|uniref:hypothetical protein n=1 Tax=Streptomyces sp. NPDC007808 TaxID=3364779 RepID=UPI003674B234